MPGKLTFMARLFKSRRERIERANSEAIAEYSRELEKWTSRRALHDQSEISRLRFFDPDFCPDSDLAQGYLSEVLGRIDWPRETTVSLEVNDSCTAVLIDVDLPEIEDMPDKIAAVAARGAKINVKDRPVVQRRKEYMTHIHGVIFRVVGEVFVALPHVQQIVASGYSQRLGRGTEEIDDEYLLSVRIGRVEWAEIDFTKLAELDLQSCFASFDLKRTMTTTGVFKPIDPFVDFKELAVGTTHRIPLDQVT